MFEVQERTKGAIGGSNEFEKQLKATTAATSRMREPAERVSRGTRRFVEGTKTLQGWGVRAGGLLGGLPPDTPPDETGGHAEPMEG